MISRHAVHVAMCLTTCRRSSAVAVRSMNAAIAAESGHAVSGAGCFVIGMRWTSRVLSAFS
jgi:hypothetical protein